MKTLEELEAKKDKLKKRLDEKRLSLGQSDGPTQSRFPTGRFELEQEIDLYEQMIQKVIEDIKSFKS